MSFEKELLRLANDYDEKELAFVCWLLETKEVTLEDCLNLAELMEGVRIDKQYSHYLRNKWYLVLTDDEANTAQDKDLENFIDECILPDIPEKYRFCFDKKKWKEERKMETNRGYQLATYDGNEHEFTFNNTNYYIYQTS